LVISSSFFTLSRFFYSAAFLFSYWIFLSSSSCLRLYMICWNYLVRFSGPLRREATVACDIGLWTLMADSDRSADAFLLYYSNCSCCASFETLNFLLKASSIALQPTL
jgi:hypothetical protein